MTAFMRLVVKGGSGLSRGASWFSHWLYSETGDEDDGPDLCDALISRVSTHLTPVLSDAWNCSRVDWTYWPIQVVQPFPTQSHPITPIVGAVTGTDPLPARMTMLIEYKGLHAKPNRKRVYVGCYNEGQNESPGRPNGAVFGGIDDYAGATMYSMSVNGHDWQFGIVRQQKIIPNEGAGYYAPWSWGDIDSYLVQQKWAYLRSRDAGSGI